MENKYEKIVAVAAKRGIIYPSAEIYGSFSGFFDYGSVGSRIKHKWENYWRAFFLTEPGLEDFFELEPTNILPQPVFEASGHLRQFVDPITECAKCGFVERADHLLETHLKESFEGLGPKELDSLIRKHKLKCHKCGGELKEVGVSNLMFGLKAGQYGDTQVFLRPETTQNPCVAFKREYLANRERLPLGLAVVGRAFRNEISPRQGLFRAREFSQAELQIFFDPDKLNEHAEFARVEDQKISVVLASERKKGVQELSCGQLAKKGLPKFFLFFMAKVQRFYDSLVPRGKFRFFEKNEEERAFYNKFHFDGEVLMESFGGFREVMGLHYRTDHDLAGHQKVSKQDLTVLREGKRVLPHIVELSFGVDRNILALLDLGFQSDEKRTWLSLPRQAAPFLAGVYPLVNKDGVDSKAEQVFEQLRKTFGSDIIYDDSGSIGKRYARADEIGIPFGITIDYDSLKDHSATVRDRDTSKQERVKTDALAEYLRKAGGA